MPDVQEPTLVELLSVKPLNEVTAITSLSEHTLRRHYGHLLVKLSPRRTGMRLRDVLKIVSGEHSLPAA